ncbi:hypothetical protein BG030_23390 [Pseudomonas putida]|nr:hypothetical protein BG030_23390 [Pseudomonas putida]
MDTAYNELKKAGLVPPAFEEVGNSFVVTVRHQKIASVIEVIEKYFEENPGGVINNKLIRQLSGEDDMQKVKKALQTLRKNGKIKVVDESANAFNVTYVKA